MQESSATPSLHLDIWGLRKIVACSQSSSQCLLVPTVFGTVSSLHPTSFLYLSYCRAKGLIIRACACTFAVRRRRIYLGCGARALPASAATSVWWILLKFGYFTSVSCPLNKLLLVSIDKKTLDNAALT